MEREFDLKVIRADFFGGGSSALGLSLGNAIVDVNADVVAIVAVVAVVVSARCKHIVD